MPVRVSVIVPHLNQPAFLERLFASLKAQTLPMADFEVIVVDNGSAVLPQEVVRTFPGARLEQEATPGPGPARNKGVGVSQAPILAFVDADCRADPGWLTAIVQRFDTDPSPRLILGGDVRIDYADSRHLTALEAYESVFAYRQREYIAKMGFSGTGNLAVRRVDFDAIGPFPGIGVAEDRVWGRRAKSLGYRISYLPSMIVFHPARKSFAEMTQKWDRHTRHDYSEWLERGGSRATWLLRATAIAVSGFLDGRKILLTDRLADVRSRLLAWRMLLRVRLYRARLMTALALGLTNREVSWNRTK